MNTLSRITASLLLLSLLSIARQSTGDDDVVIEAIAPIAIPVAVDIDVNMANDDKPKKRKTPDFLKPLANVELSFIKRVCEPTPDQMKALVAKAQEAYDELGEIVQLGNQNFIVAGDPMIMGPNNERLKENPYKRIRLDAMKYTKECVNEKQYKRYMAELRKRTIYEREAAMSIVVGIIDEKVVLTDQQLRELTEELLDQWTDIELMQLQNYRYNPQYVPVVPNAPLKKVLSRSQYDAWKSYGSTTMWMHLGQTQGMGLGEEWIK